MRKFSTLILFLSGVFGFNTLSAQGILQVEPGMGTLNAAILANGGNKIYQLQAGQWYGLDGIIENVGYHLQIIGEPYDDKTMPATVQIGTDSEGEPAGMMFDAKGDITLKNIYFVNADLLGQISPSWLFQYSFEGRVVIDNCVIDPMGQFSAVEMTGGGNDLFFTNNLCARHGNELSQNDGHCFVTAQGADPSGADTLWFENNTFVSTGMNWLYADFQAQVNNFIWINHNTFIHHKSQLEWSNFENEFYMTNNLFFDFMTAPFSYNWQPMPGGDLDMPKPMLIYADTLPDEMLPSTRSQFIEYNTLFRHQGFYDLIAEMNDTATATGSNKVNLQPFIWDGHTPAYFGADPAEAFSASREGHLFNHENNINTDFPMWKYGNVMYDVDPLFTDPMIYDLSDSLIAWTRPASFIHALRDSRDNWPPASEWPSWHWDPDGDVAMNATWPLFDGTYQNSELLRASIEGLPLGDLNWFPAAKAAWENRKEDVQSHIIALNEDTIDIGFSDTCLTAISLDYLVNPPLCSGGNDASIDISVDGNNPEFQYLWSTGAETEDIEGLEQGTYGILVTDSKGCSRSFRIDVADPLPITIMEHIYTPSCSGEDNGSIIIELSGGQDPYDITWFNETSYDTISGLSEGCYDVVVTDANDCIAQSNICIPAPDSIILFFANQQNICFGDSSASIHIQGSGGTPPYHYYWEAQEIQQQIIDLKAGNYIVTVVDANNCTASDSTSIIDPEKADIDDIVGDNRVEEFLNYQYSISNVENSLFHWFTEGGNITSGQGTNVVQIQWGSDGYGLVKAMRETEHGCLSDTTSLDVSINSTGVEMQLEGSFSLFPNPVLDILYINYNKEIAVSISNLEGKILLFTNEKRIDLSSFPKGVYIISAKSKDFVTTKKIIKL